MPAPAHRAADPLRVLLDLAEAEAGRPLPPESAAAVAAAARKALAGEAVGLDDPLGLADARAAVRRRLERRNGLLRDYAARHLAGLPHAKARAEALIRAADAYERGAFRFDRDRAACPYPDGTPRALLWAALRFGPCPRLRQLQVILAPMQ